MVKKSIHFGQAGASDFTIHKDTERKNRYLDRHSKNEDWHNPLTAGFYSRWILWNKPTITESIRDTNRKSIHFGQAGASEFYHTQKHGEEEQISRQTLKK